jgi:hypothetical protein
MRRACSTAVGVVIWLAVGAAVLSCAARAEEPRPNTWTPVPGTTSADLWRDGWLLVSSAGYTEGVVTFWEPWCCLSELMRCVDELGGDGRYPGSWCESAGESYR